MQQLVKTYQRIDHDNSIEVRWQCYFEQGDIETLSKHLLSLNNQWRVIETVEGIDRVYYRILMEGNNIQLHFEVYSQSSWFECENIQHDQSLNALIDFI